MAASGYIQQAFNESIELRQQILQNDLLLSQIEKVIERLTQLFQNNKTLLIAGNGGSAADAQHWAAEFTGRYKIERTPFKALALHVDSSFMSAWSNDYDFSSSYARLVGAYGTKKDILIVLSTSGNSDNLIQAVKEAKKIGLITIGLLGKSGGKLKDLLDIVLIVPSDNTPRIQEVHELVYHIICEETEKRLAAKD